MRDMIEHRRVYLDRMATPLRALPADEIDHAAVLLWDNYQSGRRAVVCGNDDLEERLSTLA